jgi:outer membrane lipoprotein-sorting protein
MIFVFKKKINMKLLATLLLFLTFNSIAQDKADPKSQAILDKLSAKMKDYKTFYIEFNAVVKNSSTGINENEIGKGWVKGNKFCASYGENTIISNGTKTWAVVKEEKSVYESDVDNKDEDNFNPKKLMTIWETGFKNKYEKEETLNNEKVHVIYLYPKNPSKVEYHTIILYVSQNDLELKKAIMKSKDGTTMTYSLNKLTENPVIEDSKFVFDIKKYPGYTVVKD